MKGYLRQRSDRDYCLFVLGINTSYRIGDLLRLRVCDVFDDDGAPVLYLTILEQKTRRFNKYRTTKLNDAARRALKEYVPDPFSVWDRALFPSRQGGGRGISERQAWWIIKQAAVAVGIRQRIGTHSLRKTGAYWMWKNGHPLETVQKWLGHRSPAETQTYLGIAASDVDKAVDSLNL